MTLAPPRPPELVEPGPIVPHLDSHLVPAPTGERHLHPKPSGKPDPTAHLTSAQIEALGRELDELRTETMHSRGARDAAYIRRVIKAHRYLELGSRAVLFFSAFPPAWVLGAAGLSVAKIIDNMEIGHNVIHGQWDWMRDPKIHSLGQPLYSFINALLFEYGIASYDLRLHDVITGVIPREEGLQRVRVMARKLVQQIGKDYVIFPLLAGPNALPTLTANFVASIVRNLWSNGVIICGHFPFGVDTFAYDSIEGETRGEWYVRQMLGSANISGSWLLHFMTGNLSHQIEHHLFPDLPSNRYAEIAPRVRDICRRYNLHYVTGNYPHQLVSAWAKVFYYALPNPEPDRSRGRIVADAVRDSWRGRKAKRAAKRAAKLASHA